MASRVIGTRFGDEYSTLLDEFERKSFEAHLNRSMMMGRRSFSEPGGRRMTMMIQSSPSLLISMPPPPIPLVTQQEVMIMEHNNNNNNSKKHTSSSGSSPSSGFQRVLKKLFKPIIGRKSGRKNTNNKHVPHHDHSNKDILISSKEFSKSLRF